MKRLLMLFLPVFIIVLFLMPSLASAQGRPSEGSAGSDRPGSDLDRAVEEAIEQLFQRRPDLLRRFKEALERRRKVQVGTDATPRSPIVPASSLRDDPPGELPVSPGTIRLLTEQELGLLSPAEIQRKLAELSPEPGNIENSVRQLNQAVERATAAGWAEERIKEIRLRLDEFRTALETLDEVIAQLRETLAQWRPIETPPPAPAPSPAPTPATPTPTPPAPEPTAPVTPAPAPARADAAAVTTQVYFSRTGVYRLERDVVQFRLRDREGNVYPAGNQPPLTARVVNTLDASDRGVRCDGLVWISEDVINNLIPDASRRQGLQVIWGPFWDRCPSLLEGPAERSTPSGP